MMHITDWFPTLLNMIGHKELVRPIVSWMAATRQRLSVNRSTPIATTSRCFLTICTSAAYKNFKVLTHKIEDGAAPIQQLAIPHLYNLTVNPDEDTPYNYALIH